MALSSQTLRLHCNPAHREGNPLRPGTALPKTAAPTIDIGISKVGGRVRVLSRAGQARAVLAERPFQTARPEFAQQPESEFPQERPETWTKDQRELVDGTIDLGDLHLTPERRAEVVKLVRAGAEKGLFFVSNFGVDMGLIHDVRRVVNTYFAQPIEEKEKTRTPVRVASRPVGYDAKLSVAKDGNLGENPSYREAYRVVCDAEAGRTTNMWPPALPEFRETLDELTAQLHGSVMFLGGLLAEGLGLPESYIHDKYGKILYDMFMSSSPPQKLKPGQKVCTSLSSHSDPNLFNINVFDGHRGLQYYTDGKWLTIPAVLDRALINLGDDFETISNGIYHSAYHRVVTGPATRLSMIVPCETVGDAILEPAAELMSDHNPARYITRRRIDRLEMIVHRYSHSLKPDRTKDGLVFNPDQDVDTSKNIYTEDGEDYINGARVLDWDVTL